VIDRSAMQLGRHKPTAEQKKRALSIERYIKAPLPPGPPSCKNTDGAPIGMWGNDTNGNCTLAALANMWAIDATKEKLPFSAETSSIVNSYYGLTGGPDSGLIEHDVLNAALKGIDLGGPTPWQVAVWVSVDPLNFELWKSLIAKFWSLYLGVELPNAAQSEETWLTPTKETGIYVPGSWGGHALVAADYDPNLVGLVTWGGITQCEWGWLRAYCDETYCLLDANRAAQIGVDFDALLADVAALS
jgi:hypothetical protein